MKYTCLRILLILCLFGCNSSENDNFNKQGQLIKITKNGEFLSKLDMINFFSTIEIVLLEDSPNAIIGKPEKLRIYDNKFYIHDENRNCITVFNANGEFIVSTMNQEGRGPGQYVSCDKFTINPQNGNIITLDPVKSTIFEYDLTGKFLEQINYPKDLMMIDDFELLNEDIYAFYSAKGFKDRNNSLVLFKPKNNEIFKELVPVQNQRLQVSTNSNVLYRFNESLHLNHIYPSSSTYLIDNNTFELHEKYHFDFEKLNFDPSILPENPKLHNELMQDYYPKYAIIFDKFENRKNVFVSFFHKNNSGMAIYCKDTQECVTKLNPPNSNGMLLSPQFVDNQYLYYLTSFEIAEYLIHPDLLSESAVIQLEKSHKNDNMIIIKYKFNN